MTSSSPSLFTLCVVSLSSPLSLRESRIRAQTVDIFNAISHVRTSLDKAKSLLSSLKRSSAIQPHTWSDYEGAIRDTGIALKDVQLLVEPLRVDEIEKGEFRWESRARWAALDKKKLGEKMNQLGIQHQSLTCVIGKLGDLASRTHAPIMTDRSPLKTPSFQHRHSVPGPAPAYTPSSLMDWKRKGKKSLIEYRTSSASSGTTAAHSPSASPSASALVELHSVALPSSQSPPLPELGYSSSTLRSAAVQPAPCIYPPQQFVYESVASPESLEKTRHHPSHVSWSGYSPPPRSFQASIDIDEIARGKEVWYPPHSPEYKVSESSAARSISGERITRRTWLGGQIGQSEQRPHGSFIITNPNGVELRHESIYK